MTLEEQIQAAVNRALAALDGSAEYELREAQTELMEYYADNMNSATTVNHVVTKSGKRRALPNKTDKLYVLYGKLVRALTPKMPGNIGEFKKEAAVRYAKIGIDLDVVPYARVHEFGGGRIPARPYFYPAIKLYAQERLDERLARIVDTVRIAWKS